MSWIIQIVTAIIGLFSGRKKQTEERLGAATVRNQELEAGITTIQKADTAAKEARKEHDANVEAGYDPDDLADPRNADKLRNLR